MFDIDEYDYELPPDLIAQVPVSRRDHSRLLVVERQNRSFSDHHFFDLPEHLRDGDLIVINDTRVFPARLFGQKESGGRAEILVLDAEDTEHTDGEATTRSCLIKSSKRPKVGSRLFFGAGVTGKVMEVLTDGVARIAFEGEKSIDSLLEERGQIPLPPYIRRSSHKNDYAQLDRERYQTVYSRQRGAVAAPTAGLHFTRNLLDELKQFGIGVTSLTLHVGYGTFQPVRTSDIRNHQLGEEFYQIGPEAAKAITETKNRGGRVIAVGTTVVRTLETAGRLGGFVEPGSGKTSLLITPGHSFKVVDALITNFHLPKSSLLFLVSAFAGLELIKEAYEWAVQKQYRFFSYGDAMLII